MIIQTAFALDLNNLKKKEILNGNSTASSAITKDKLKKQQQILEWR
ncbi:hypothetical protein ACFSKL_07310 [Belliella marina]|uniref:Uncharacterized protein n=1 Tax=Belliella marina TaxID=1644146 RepID=A0ABW4VP85_9BACT